MGLTIAIVLFDGAEERDWAGPGRDESVREVRRYIQYDPEPPV